MSPIKLKPFLLPKLLRYSLFLALSLVAIWYVGFQARYLITGPEVTMLESPATVQNERVIVLKGVANNVTSLHLNGRPIAIDQEGAFAEGVVLENGYTVVSIDARDRYGRVVHWEQPFVYVDRSDVVQR